MKRTCIDLIDIADQSNLTLALYKASKGKRQRAEVQRFYQQAQANLNTLAKAILEEQLPYGRYHSFTINDPKQRIIHAACFEDRIFHHAVMNKAAPVFERAMVDHTYACRPGKGVHRAVKQVQKNLQSYSWYVQIDIDSYFANIDHRALMQVLMRRFKGRDIQRLFWRILHSHETADQQGLPIGALTSQYFANYFLDGVDRFLNEDPRVGAAVRYMDDIVWWCDNRERAKAVLEDVKTILWQQRLLTIKPTVQIQASTGGISYCGFRIKQGTVRLSRRRKRRYQERRLYWEHEYKQGRITANQLQTAYAAVHSITQGTDSGGWRRENLRRHPPIDA